MSQECCSKKKIPWNITVILFALLELAKLLEALQCALVCSLWLTLLRVSDLQVMPRDMSPHIGCVAEVPDLSSAMLTHCVCNVQLGVSRHLVKTVMTPNFSLQRRWGRLNLFFLHVCWFLFLLAHSGWLRGDVKTSCVVGKQLPKSISGHFKSIVNRSK